MIVGDPGHVEDEIVDPCIDHRAQQSRDLFRRPHPVALTELFVRHAQELTSRRGRLLAIGLAVTGNIPRTRAAIAAALVWLLGAAPLLLQAR